MRLSTPRLRLRPLTRQMMERRLKQADFVLAYPLESGVLDIHFGPEWPGDPLEAFALFLSLLPQVEVLSGSFVAVEKAIGEVVGMLGSKVGSKARPDVASPEIGYGFNPAAQGRGYATEAGRALLGYLLTFAQVRQVTAQTAPGNRASERVLEKLGFVPRLPPQRLTSSGCINANQYTHA